MLMRWSVVVALAALSGCVSVSRSGCSGAADPAELARLATAADSLSRRLRVVPESLAVVFRQSLHAVLDRAVELDRCGRVATPPELRGAARVGLEAGILGEPALSQAYDWARRAVMLDTADHRSWRVMAHAWDRLQLSRKQPQWFATVITCAGTPDGRCTLSPIDTMRVSDPQRVEIGLRTLVQQRTKADSINRARGRP